MPIGLIESSWGGTSVETWMPDEAIEDCGLNKLPDYVSFVPTITSVAISPGSRHTE